MCCIHFRIEYKYFFSPWFAFKMCNGFDKLVPRKVCRKNMLNTSFSSFFYFHSLWLENMIVCLQDKSRSCLLSVILHLTFRLQYKFLLTTSAFYMQRNFLCSQQNAWKQLKSLYKGANWKRKHREKQETHLSA